MSNRFVTACGYLFLDILQEVPSHSVLIFVACDILVALATIIGNSIFMVTLMKTTSLHTPSNILLGALCFSDLLVGFIAQPITISYYAIMGLEQTVNIALSTAYSGTRYLCTELSSLYVVLISLDRYVAVCHPYKYHSTATSKTHICIVIVAAVLFTCFAGTRVFLATEVEFEIIRMSLTSCFIIVIILSYACIFKVVLRHRRAISNQTESNLDSRQREHHTTFTMAIIISIFFLCYLPYTGLYLYHFIRGTFCWDSQLVYILNHWALFLVLLNSFLNPIVYYARSKEIRDAILKVLRPNRTAASLNLQTQRSVDVMDASLYVLPPNRRAASRNLQT